MNTKFLFLATLIFIFGCNKPEESIKANWIRNALSSLENNDFPRVKAISWWHENFDKSELRIDSSPESLQAYQDSISSSTFVYTPVFFNNKLIASNEGIYHSAYPDFGGTEDIVTTQRISDFEQLAGKKIVWAYFSNNWGDSIQFPADAVKIIHDAGRVPFIRLMPRSEFEESQADPIYSMQKIIDGDFDTALVEWAKTAANTGFPLLAEFGTEVNGNWFSWNGQYNGGATTNEYGDPNLSDGPERFVDAYKHIIDICRSNGANNITWFFHVDAYSEPAESWNDIKNYYPGNDYIDWIGVSVYGPQAKGEDFQEFKDIMNDVYPKLTALSPDKPIAILEFAITEL